jgi:drug/metabolite transporter (DMT)-like permease
VQETPDARQRRLGIAAAIAAYLAWGFLSPGGKLLLEDGGPWTINLLRTALSLVAFVLLFGRATTVRVSKALARHLNLWILGVPGLGLTLTLYLYSVDRLEPTISTVLLYLSPIVIAVAARRLFKERLHPLAVPVALVTLAGVLLTIWTPQGGFGLTGTHGEGLLLGVLSVGGWVFYTLWLRKLSSTHPENDLTLAAFATSGVLFLAGTILVEGFDFTFTTRSTLLLALYVALPSVISFQLYTVAVKRAGAGVAAILIGVELISTAIISAALGQETFGGTKILGLAIVLAAVTIFIWRQNQIAPPTAA